MNTINFLDWLQDLANVRTAAVSLAIVAASLTVFTRFVSPWLESRMGGQRVLDLMFWRSPDDVDAALEAYGTSGRRWYRRYLVGDALFPVLYCPLLAVSVSFTAGQLHFPSQYEEVAAIIPFIGGVFDWGENLLLWVQASRFPHQDERLSWMACAFTVLKFAALIPSALVSFLGLAFAPF